MGPKLGDDGIRRENGVPGPMEKAGDGDLVRGMVAFAAGRPMEAEIEAPAGAAREAGSKANPKFSHPTGIKPPARS